MEADPAGCLNTKVCNWNDCDGLPQGVCAELCASSTSEFCGVCWSSPSCEKINSINDKDVCEAINVCVLPNGSIMTSEENSLIPAQQCHDAGQCDAFCHDLSMGTQCVSATGVDSVCVSDLEDEDSCYRKGGEWDGDIAVCAFGLLNNQAECEKSGYTFLSCQNLSPFDCGDCENFEPDCPLQEFQNLLLCYSSSRSRCDKDDCIPEGGAGTCSDEVLTNPYTFPPVRHSCVFPFVFSLETRFCAPREIVTQIG